MGEEFCDGKPGLVLVELGARGQALVGHVGLEELGEVVAVVGSQHRVGQSGHKLAPVLLLGLAVHSFCRSDLIILIFMPPSKLTPKYR